MIRLPPNKIGLRKQRKLRGETICCTRNQHWKQCVNKISPYPHHRIRINSQRKYFEMKFLSWLEWNSYTCRSNWNSHPHSSELHTLFNPVYRPTKSEVSTFYRLLIDMVQPRAFLAFFSDVTARFFRCVSTSIKHKFPLTLGTLSSFYDLSFI